MRFIDVTLRRLRLSVWGFIVLAAGGCQMLPDTPSPEAADSTETASADKETAEKAAGAEQPLPNPYRVDPPSVPGAARQRFDDALAALEQQQWQAAETDLLWITEHHPELSGPYLNLALLYQRSQQPDKVEPAFRQAIAATPDNVAAYNQYAIYLRQQGRFADAEAQYLRALEVWPDSPNTHLNLGILYDLYMGQLQQALKHYRAYQALQPEPDRRVQGWIVDTERRLARQAPAGGAS